MARAGLEGVPTPTDPKPLTVVNELCEFNLALDADACAAKAEAAGAAAAERAGSDEALANLERADQCPTYAGMARWADPGWGPWRALLTNRPPPSWISRRRSGWRS